MTDDKKPLSSLIKGLISIAVLVLFLPIIFPIPVLLLDILIAVNLIFALPIFIIALHTKKAGNFSLCPKLFRVSSVSSLIINLYAMRLILAKGAAFDSHIISFVSGLMFGFGGTKGLVIGMIIYLAISIFLVLVIAKGSVHVAEVAAGFIFYAFVPGKQRAMESEYQIGKITEEECTARKEELQREDDYYGTMDGVSFFISRTQKVNVFITAITVLVGILIGTVSHGRTILDAALVFIPIAIGNGILSMVPAFLHSLATGILVTRDLPFIRPTIFWYGSYIPPQAPDTIDPIRIELGWDLIPLADKDKGADLLRYLQNVRHVAALEMGIVIPQIHIIDNLIHGASEYCIKIYDAEAGRGVILMDHYLCLNPGTAIEEIPGEKANEPVFGLPAIWITEDRKEEARRLGYNVVDPQSIIINHLIEIIKNHAAEFLDCQADFLDRQMTHSILEELRNDHPEMVEEVLETLSLSQIQKVLQNLLREQVSIKNMIKILETLAEHGKASSDIKLLTEEVKQGLENK
jgi:flagellar biosynthesis protein FlhA